jgi:hypothetical protein
VAEMSDAGKLLFATDGKLVYHPTSSALLCYPNAVRMTVVGNVEYRVSYYPYFTYHWRMMVAEGSHVLPWNGSAYYAEAGPSVWGNVRVGKISSDPEIWEARVGYQWGSYDWCYVYFQASSLTGTYAFDREWKTWDTRHDVTSIEVEEY